MGESEDKVVCFQCGQPVLDEESGVPRLNEVAEGEESEPCKACADRLLEQLPPIFHTPWSRGGVQAQASDDYSAQGDSSGEGGYSGEGA